MIAFGIIARRNMPPRFAVGRGLAPAVFSYEL